MAIDFSKGNLYPMEEMGESFDAIVARYDDEAYFCLAFLVFSIFLLFLLKRKVFPGLKKILLGVFIFIIGAELFFVIQFLIELFIRYDFPSSWNNLYGKKAIFTSFFLHLLNIVLSIVNLVIIRRKF